MKKNIPKIIILLISVLTVLCITVVPAFADDGRVTVTQNEGGSVELHSDAKKVADGVYQVSGNSQILFYITPDDGYTLAHVYFNEQDLGYGGTGTKQVWLSPNGSSTALRVEFESITPPISSEEVNSSVSESSGASSAAIESSSTAESSGSVSQSESQSDSSGSVVSAPSAPDGNLDNQDMLNDGIGVIQQHARKDINWGRIGLIAAVVIAVIGAIAFIVLLIKKGES